MSIEWLLDSMQANSSREAMVFRSESVMYRELLDRFAEWKVRLAAADVKPGQTVALVGGYSPDLCGAFLALLDQGNIIVPMSAEGGRQQEQLEIAHAEAVITLKDGSREVAQLEQARQPDMLRRLAASGRPGMILFTSGTTGRPKAIVHDMVKFMERYRTPRAALRTLSLLRFDHIGGLNTLFHTFANGGTVICPETLSPGEICSLMERFRSELLPATPSFLNLLLITGAYRQYDLSSLKVITYGTEVMPGYTLARLLEAFPGVQLRQTYGLSEVGILRAKSQSAGSLLFKAGGEGVEVQIRDGILHIRSQWAMEGYLNAPDPFDKDGWFNTQDQVVEEGEFFRIIGRRSEIINVGGQKVYPAEVEEVLLRMPELRDATVQGEPNVLLGQMVAATVNLAEGMELDPRELKLRIRAFCQGRLESFQIPVKVYIEREELFSDRFKKIRS